MLMNADKPNVDHSNRGMANLVHHVELSQGYCIYSTQSVSLGGGNNGSS